MEHQAKQKPIHQKKASPNRNAPLQQVTGHPAVENLLQLQRTIGNRATMQLLKNHYAQANQQTEPPAQLYKHRFKPDPKVGAPDLKNLDDMADELNTQTMDAHARVYDALKNDAIKDDKFPEIKDTGYYKNWKFNPSAMTTGYAIEALVNHWAEGRQGYISQYSTGNARLDFYITDGLNKGVVDITSSKEQGHVWGKDFSKGSFAYIAEAIYNSIDFNSFSGFTLSDIDLMELGRIQAKRANEDFCSRLFSLQKVLELMSCTKTYKNVSQVRLMIAKGEAVDREDINSLDQELVECRAYNRHLETISDIITSVQKYYEVKGDPPW